MSEAYLTRFETRGDYQRGFLSFAEAGRSIPFEIKRAYWIHQVPSGAVRGGHAHRRVRQVFLCLHGRAEFEMDLGTGYPRSCALVPPDQGLYTSEMVWLTMSNFTPGTVILVLASDYYDAAEYIRDYQEFLKLVKGG